MTASHMAEAADNLGPQQSLLLRKRLARPDRRRIGFRCRGFLQYAIDDYPVRLVALDTLVPDEGGGLLCSERLGWLDHALALAPARPVLIMMHHPPFLTGIERMDRAGLQNSEALAVVVVRHPQVERILCGHLHRAIDRRFAGTVAGTAPSTAHQLRLNLTPEAPLRFMFEPPGYQLHVWREDSGLVTHTAVFGEWSGPHPLPAT
jgi:3',5'-cyclic-AMP phosphodiesterase